MSRMQFPIPTDLLELLLAFEESEGLGRLAEKMARDPSVVSRNLQRLAELAPVLEKVRGRWELTPLGHEINAITRDYLAGFGACLREAGSTRGEQRLYLSNQTALLVINAQQGLSSPELGRRNNEDAEANIERLLAHWRTGGRTIVHVKHVSANPDSLFHRGSRGADFMPGLAPAGGETTIEKSKSSAFADTKLAASLQNLDIDTLVLAGFTANECIDATARQASDMGFTVFVAGDATAMFDFSGPDGKLMKAERIHRLTLANLNALYAKVLATDELVAHS